MDRRAKPIPKTGERNVYCPYYGGCLDYAIDRTWESWDCSLCEHKTAHQSSGEWDYEITEPLPYYELPPAIAESILDDLFQ